MVCVRKPNSLAYRGGVRKPGDFAGRVQEGPAGLGLRTKTEFIGLQRNRTQTGRFCQPSSGGSGRLWFAYENRIHWLSREASANRGAPPEQIPGAPATKVRARKPNSLAFRAGEREPGKPLEQIQGAPAAKVRARKPNLLAFRGDVRKLGDSAGRVQEGPAGLDLHTKTEFIGLQGRRTQTGRLCRPGSGGDGRPWFAYENRIHWLSREASANRGAPPEQIPGAPAAKVRARKPNLLAFRGGEREPGKPLEQIQGAPTAKVRARKPNSLAFRAGEREPGKPLEQIPDAPAAKVRARKPNSLAFTGDEREPGKPAEQIQGPTGGRKSPQWSHIKRKNFEVAGLTVNHFKVSVLPNFIPLQIASYL